MKITGFKTHKITPKDRDILKILDKYIKNLSDKSIVAVASKIVAIAEGRTVKIKSSKLKVQNLRGQKDELIKQESEFYLPREENPYNVSLTVTRGNLVASAGIDESNGGGYYVLWPKDPQESANRIREFLRKKFKIKNLGVIITDSRTTPLRWGVTGIAIAYSGFEPLKNYIGKKDIFGRKLEFTKLSLIDNLASSAILVMGEGNEQTPVAVISDIDFVKFQTRSPIKKELESLKISIDEDLYGPFLSSVPWRKGQR